MKYSISKYRSVILSFVTACVLLAGCTKGLEEQPKSFVSTAEFYTDPNQLYAVFSSSMNNLYGGWGPYDSHYEYAGYTDQYANGNLIIPVTHGNRMWNAHYKSIGDLNHAIKSLQERGIDKQPQELVDGLIGHARFLRGWNYFQLVRYYGSLVLLTDSSSNYYDVNASRSPVEEVYHLILSDFEYAMQHIPDVVQQGMPTKEVATAMLAMAHLTMATYPLQQTENYSKAADYAWQVIQSGKYSLVPDINRVFTKETEYGPELMWGFHATTADPSIAAGTWFNFGVSVQWLNNFPEQPRKYAWFNFKDENGVPYLDQGMTPSMQKYLYAGDLTNGLLTAGMPIMRYADVLLIYAEAANMAAGTPSTEAVWAINQVIERANGNDPDAEDELATTDMSAEAFDEKVIQERNWEFSFEGSSRWFDLIRKHILKENALPEFQQNFTEDDYLWPIPLYDLRNAPNLAQNPGYPTN